MSYNLVTKDSFGNIKIGTVNVTSSTNQIDFEISSVVGTTLMIYQRNAVNMIYAYASSGSFTYVQKVIYGNTMTIEVSDNIISIVSPETTLYTYIVSINSSTVTCTVSTS